MACLDQIERFIQSDIAGVDDAIDRVNDVLSEVSSATYEFERVTPIGDGDAAGADGPIELRWRVGGIERTMFVCSSGDTVEVGSEPCSS